MRPWIPILVGVIVLVASLVPTFYSPFPVARETLGPVSQMTYLVAGSFGSIPVSVTWQTESGTPYVLTQFCPPGSSPRGAGCAQPQVLNGVSSDSSASGGTTHGTVPAGSVLVITLLGAAGSSAQVNVDVGAPAVGVALFAIGFTAIGIGLWMRRRLLAARGPTDEEEEVPDLLIG